MTPLQVIMNTLPNMGRAGVALHNIEELGLTLTPSKTEEYADEKQLATVPAWQSIELRDVTHTYQREGEDTQFVLGPVNLTFRAGELVFLTGGNGSGKTTLAKLMIGLYAPEAGELRINGEPVTDENRDWYRQHFTVVFSDFFLFDSLLGLEAPKLDDKARECL